MRPPAAPQNRRISRALAAAAFAAFATLPGSAGAQIFDQGDWVEAEVPPPPAFDLKRSVEISMPKQMQLRYSVDPQTIAIGPDGVVRYVILASRPGPDGAVNAFYEGIRCHSAETRTYARYSGDAWQPSGKSEWTALGLQRSRHSEALAVQAVCRGRAPRGSVDEMVRTLKSPVPTGD